MADAPLIPINYGGLKTKLALFALLVLSLLTGCGERLEAGRVIEKRHESETTFVMFIPISMSCGKGCATTMMIPYWIFDDEDFILVVEGRDSKGKTIKEKWYTSMAEYESTEISDWKGFEGTLFDRTDKDERLRKASDNETESKGD